MLKNAFGEYWLNLLNTTNENPYKLILFHFTYPTVHIFDICQGNLQLCEKIISYFIPYTVRC